jgi:hypothetical protein
MTAIDSGEFLSPDTATRLADFARACKAAARVVALYPATHPTIQAALGRVADSAVRLRREAAVALTVLPDSVLLDGRAAARPDGALGELAALLHAHLIGELRLTADLTPIEWHTFLLLLARAPEDVRSEGGIARAWIGAGAAGLEIRQIDYSEVLRERSGGLESGWDRIIAGYLEGEFSDLDEDAIGALFAIAENPARFKAFAAQLVARASEGGLRGTKETVLRVLQALADFTARRRPEDLDRILNQIAGAIPQLTPDLVVTLITTGVPPDPSGAPGIDLPGAVRERLSDHTVGEFVAQSVSRDQGATARLAEAFQTLVPDRDKHAELLDVARREAERLPVGQQPEFPDLWKSAAELLTSYSDSKFVSDDYSRELAHARAQAIEVERVSDDPPERVNAWLSTVSDSEVQRLDHQVLLDLLAIETRPEAWRQVVESAVTTIDELVVTGNIALAQQVLDRIVTAAAGKGAFAETARAGVQRLLSGPLMQHVVLFVRRAQDDEVEAVAAFCRAIGPGAIRPLAEALAAEQGSAVRRLRDILLSFGPAGRAYADELRNSANPAVRRTAVDLLRAFGGADALPDLMRLVDDAEPAVQRDAVRAIVQIGSAEAYAALGHAIASSAPPRRAVMLQALTTQRDERATPLFVYLLAHSDYRGSGEAVYTAAIDALGQSRGDADAVDALKTVLYRGEWLAPRRTRRLRAAAARALRAAGSPLAQQALDEAANKGARGVRRAARAALSAPAPRIPPRRTV